MPSEPGPSDSYVLSRTSNHKEGPRNELHIAKNIQRSQPDLKDFIIPLHIDDLPYGEINVQLTSQIAIPFENSWAAGYDQLLKRLETDGVSKKPGFNPQAVASWWRAQFSPTRGLVPKNDRHISNWLKVHSIPDRVYFHALKRNSMGLMELKTQPPFPAFLDGYELVTFAPEQSFEGKLNDFSIVSSRHIETSAIIGEPGDLSYEAHNLLRNLMIRLLKECWNGWMASKGLGQFELADHGLCFYFKKPNDADQLSLGFIDSEGKQHRHRGVVGFKSRLDHTKRFWHFALQSRPIFRPFTAFSLSLHVVFSDDGRTVWSNPKKMHKARRRQCKSWQNDEWRDKFLASVHWLSNGSGILSIPVGPEQTIEVISVPCEFDAPLGFDDPPTRTASERAQNQNRNSAIRKLKKKRTANSRTTRIQRRNEFMSALIHLPEPQLLFRHDQPMEDPRDGLTLFGPPNPSPRGIEAGVIGTPAGIERFRRWCERLQRYIPPLDLEDEQFYLSHPPFPGFQAAFEDRSGSKGAGNGHIPLL